MSEQSPPSGDEEEGQLGEQSVIQPPKGATLSISLGLAIFGFAVFYRSGFGSPNEYHLAFAAGLGLIFWGVGSRATGRFFGWWVGGAVAIALVLFLALKKYDPAPVVQPAIIALFEGPDLTEINTFEVIQSPKQTPVLGAWVSFIPKSFIIRIEKDDAHDSCFKFSLYDQIKNEPFTLAINSGFLEKTFYNNSNLGNIPLNFNFENGNLYFSNGLELFPVGFSDCFKAKNGGSLDKTKQNKKRSLGTPQGYLRGIISSAIAAIEPNVPIAELIKHLQDKNGLIRQSARLSLAQRGSEAIRPLMDALTRNPKEYQLKLGSVIVLSEILGTVSEVLTVRKELSQSDINLLVPLMMDSDARISKRATDAMILLTDLRAAKLSVRTLNRLGKSSSSVNIAFFLNSTFQSFDNSTKQEISSELSSFEDSLEPKTRELLEPVVNYESHAAEAASGWVYVGTNFGEIWDERLFDWDGSENRLPKIGDILTAEVDVNLRKDHIQYRVEEKGWVNAPVVGLIKTGEKVKVTAVKSVTFGFYWIQVNVEK